jgi:hypothetical protein
MISNPLNYSSFLIYYLVDVCNDFGHSSHIYNDTILHYSQVIYNISLKMSHCQGMLVDHIVRSSSQIRSGSLVLLSGHVKHVKCMGQWKFLMKYKLKCLSKDYTFS